MKICERALFAQVMNRKGDVRPCAWAGFYTLGNLKENTLAEIYHSDAAKRFQQSLIDGTYDFCNSEECPYMANNELEQHIIEVDELPEYPQWLSLSYDNRCNYNCTCCVARSNQGIDPEVENKIEEGIRDALPHIQWLNANGQGEFFASPGIMKLVSEWKPENIENAEFCLESNGSLFTPQNWEKIKNLAFANLSVVITVHSFEEAAYQYLSGTKIKISQIEENLRFIHKLREEGKVNTFIITTVMQERNFRTLPQFIERCLNEFKADQVRIRRFLPERAMDENIEWFFDIRNPLHPYHQEYLDVMKHPIFKDPRLFIWTGDKLSMRGELPAKANYCVLKDLFFIENVGEKLSDYLKGKGYDRIALYALSDIAKALIKIMEGQSVKIAYIYDRNSKLTEWNGCEVRKPINRNLVKTKEPLLVTLIARHGEMEEFLRQHEYAGEILCLEKILYEIKKEQC